MSILAWRNRISEKIESIEWKRPGIFQVIISKVYLSNSLPEFPSLGNLFDSGGQLKLIAKELQNQGVFSKCILTYQGGKTFSSPTAGSNPEDEQWAADVVLDQEDISMHPNIASILKAGGGSLYRNKVSWPRMIYEEKKEKNAEVAEVESKKKPVKNPFYGTTSYFVPRVEVSRQKFYKNSSGSIDASVLKNIGLIDAAAEGWMGDSILSASTTKKTQDGKVLKTVWMSGAQFKKEIYS